MPTSNDPLVGYMFIKNFFPEVCPELESSPMIPAYIKRFKDYIIDWCDTWNFKEGLIKIQISPGPPSVLEVISEVPNP
ncbi:MAG: hypothetical protein WC796_03105 [Candidatus Pacearchaeota archaeon]|jgi:hypothetical protein